MDIVPRGKEKSARNLLAGEHHGATSECSECFETFCGERPHALHRLGNHGVYEGPDRRRCLSVAEMAARGFTRCGRGRWSAGSSSATRSRTVVAA